MTTTTFENAKVGDKVYSVAFGWGEVICTDGFEHYPLGVRFQNTDIDTHYFTLDGCYYADNPIRSLFWTEMKVVPIIESTTTTTTTKIVNGVEIPNISYIPEPHHYCNIPAPTCPELYKRVSCYTNKYINVKHMITHGLCYPDTEKGKAAAILHAKAMLGIQL
jgi:hypothetical protein